MIKVFSPNDTVFTSAGNKALKPISCKETKIVNDDWFIKAELGMGYIDFIQQDSIIVCPTKYNSQPFRVANLSAKKTITFTAYHIGFDSKLFIIDSLTTSGLTAQNCLNAVIAATTDSNHFTAYSDITATKTLTFSKCTLYEAILAIQEAYGGYLDFNGWQIRLTSTLGADRGVTIQYGKNLEEAEVYEDWKDVCTKILPLGNNDITLTPKTRSSAIVYDRPYARVQKFNTSDLAELEALALEHLAKYEAPKVNYKVKSTLQNVYLNDDIKVIARQYTLMANVLSYTYNTLTARNESVEFGNYVRTARRAFSAINNSLDEIKNRTNELNTIVAIQTELINNAGTYGYCIKTENEMYFVDTVPLSSATNVMRLNVAGLGFSQTGVAGPYTNAFTLDGNLNADFINGLTITGVKIETTEDMKVGKILEITKVVPTTTTELVQMRKGRYGIHFGNDYYTDGGVNYPYAYISAYDRKVLAGISTPAIGVMIRTNKDMTVQGDESLNLVFGALETADSNTMSDYREGTWTPIVGGTATYGSQYGSYVKVGNVVTIFCRLIITTIGTGSKIDISGLPFPATSEYFPILVGYYGNLTTAVSFLGGIVAGSSILLRSVLGTSGTSMGANNVIGNGTDLYISATYKTTS